MISDLLISMDKVLDSFVHNGYNALLGDDFKTIMLRVITIYIAWIGWKVIHHWQGFSAGEFVKEALRIAIIYSIATEWDFFAMYMYNVLTNAPAELSEKLIASTHGSDDISYTALQIIFDKGINLGCLSWSKGSWHSPLAYLVGFDIWIMVSMLIGVVIVTICIAKCCLAMLLVLTPLFVYFLFSNSLKGLTESWLKLILGFALVPLFLNIALLFTGNIINTTMIKIAAVLDIGNILNPEATGDFMTIIMIFNIWIAMSIILLVKSSSLAMSIGNGMAITSMGKMFEILHGVHSAPKKMEKNRWKHVMAK